MLMNLNTIYLSQEVIDSLLKYTEDRRIDVRTAALRTMEYLLDARVSKGDFSKANEA